MPHADPAAADPSGQPRLTPMEAHHRVCPKRRIELECTKLSFYDAGVNGVWRSGGVSSSASEEEVAPPSQENELDETEGHAPVSSAVGALTDVPRDELWDLIDRLRAIGAKMGIGPNYVEQTDREAAAASAEADAQAPLRAASRQRHALQHVGFFSLLERHDLLRRGSLVLEVGAGKAGLAGHLAKLVAEETTTTVVDGHAHTTEAETSEMHNKRRKTDDGAISSSSVSTASAGLAATAAASAASAVATRSTDSPAYTLVVLDRGSFKHKTDTSIRRVQQCALTRYRIDLQDVRLERMPEVQQWAAGRTTPPEANDAMTDGEATASSSPSTVRPLTMVIGKHVCGQATDFVCKAVARANQTARQHAETTAPSDRTTSAAPSASAPLIECVAIATCCHHLCVWENYCNPGFMESLGLTAKDFHAMTRMSTWRTCGYRPHSDNKDAIAAAAAAAKETGETVDESIPVTDSPTDASTSSPSSSLRAIHPTAALSVAAREHLGVICKHLFDTGRVAFLRESADLSRLAHRVPYATSALTKENFCVLAA